MVRCLNLSEKQNKHMKAEINMISSIGKEESAEILYPDAQTAERRARNIKQKLKGTEISVETVVYGNTVVVTRL